MSRKRNRRNRPRKRRNRSDFAFQIRLDTPCSCNCATIEVWVSGVKGMMEADSCSTANIVDKHKLKKKKQNSIKNKVAVRPTDTRLFVFAQKEPVPFIGCFDAKIKSISSVSRAMATFLVAKGTTESWHLLRLDTWVELRLLHLTNAAYEKKRETASQAIAPSTDPVITRLTSGNGMTCQDTLYMPNLCLFLRLDLKFIWIFVETLLNQ